MLKLEKEKISGKKIGKKLGFPTLNFPLNKRDKVKRGVWVVKLKHRKKELFGVANVGKAKTFNGEKEQIEVYLFNFPKKGIKRAEIYFLKYLRKTKRFKKIKALREQIKKDIKKAKAVLNLTEEESLSI